MKRMTYVDNEGNTTNINYERNKLLLRILLILNIVVPIIIIGLIIYKVTINKQCNKLYDIVKKASLVYIKDRGETPSVEGEYTTINISDLYSEQYLKSISTNNMLCTGTVKITKYKDEYIYTLDIKNCDKCSVDKKYKDWTDLQTNYPKNKSIIDTVAFYNYYDRELNTTRWSKYYDEEEISDEMSKYGIKIPLDESELPEIPEEGIETNIESEIIYYYRYRDRSWKWYDIEGDYSSFSSERPDGYANKDEESERYTDWTEYSLDYPEEKDYREIKQSTGYKFYYLNKNGEKIYYNNGKYTPSEEVSSEKYDMYDEKTTELYSYRDKQWRWYNGQKRDYSGYRSEPNQYATIKDRETEILGNPTQWSEKRFTDETTKDYRVEEKKLMTRFRRQYEILSLPMLKKPLKKDEFEIKEKTSLKEFASRDDKKIEVSYKFRYRKS